MGYRYLAYNDAGVRTRGELNVDTQEAAERLLWERGLTIVELKPSTARIDWAALFPTVLGPKRREVIIFTQQLANLIEAGIPLVGALELLSEEASSRSLRTVLAQVLDDLRIGSPLSDALARHPTVFPPIYMRMIQVGERTGNLAAILRRLATHMEKEVSVMRKVRGALAYPLFVLALAGVVVVILVNFTLPPLLSLYREFDAELPFITQLLLFVTDFFLANQVKLFLFFIALLVLGFFMFNVPWGREKLDALALRLPLIGKVTLQGNVARLSSTLAALLNAGLALPESLALTARTVSNKILADALDVLRNESIQGRGLAAPLAAMEVFPRMLAQIVRVGEETGTLDTHLTTLAGYYEEEVDRSLKTMTTFIEPALIIFVGLIVAFVAISVILPMYSLLSAIQ